MDGHIPPMVLYGVLALAIGVTGKVTEKDVSDGKLLRQRPWLMLVLHAPVLLAWLHVCFYVLAELFAPKMRWNTVEFAHVAFHAFVLAFVGFVCMVTYALQLHHWRSDSTGIKQG